MDKDSINSLHNFWFAHEDIWFDATENDDQIIKQKFGLLINDNPNIESIKHNKDIKELLTTILLYDQIIRHVFRGNTEKIKELSKFSLELTLFVLENKMDKEYLPKERCFILMPLRHTFDLKYLEIALDKIKEYREDGDCNYYIRFYKATILSMSKIKTPLIVPEEINYDITNEQIFNTLDSHCVKNLEHIKPMNPSEPIHQAFINTLSKLHNPKEITLSLSGGVDSMISSFNLYHLSQQQTKFKIIAITIDYGNREDNKYEVEFVKRWCKLLGITHYVKHITELKRNKSIDRDLYEKLTRTLRFDMYRRFNNPVVLGHNLGDCLENIFNNIKKSRSLNNLRGMSDISNEEECTIVRPMLNISKRDIRDFAKRYAVPHLPNSTPSWSERGKIRDELIPFLNRFDENIIPGMIQLADNMKQMYHIYETSIIDRFYETIKFNEYQVMIPLSDNAHEKQYGFVFWKDIISRILKTINFQFPSNKAFRSMNERIAHNRYGIIKMSKRFEFNYIENGLTLKIKDKPQIQKIENKINESKLNIWSDVFYKIVYYMGCVISLYIYYLVFSKFAI
ncbi:tRNAIle-lysidine synthase TilS/MesJ [Klosneuvirus KNV1]|uniref:tRNA(Ile)-lysidine synthetase n=1 Tax=Klosneuvirus KNV1 TaxID=1977640 RepID=A0A1V0SI91_9VIRU|nr:tRNAIle-lysidine synthase TilS/MesJ [Klosneuvirus KNV1]